MASTAPTMKKRAVMAACGEGGTGGRQTAAQNLRLGSGPKTEAESETRSQQHSPAVQCLAASAAKRSLPKARKSPFSWVFDDRQPEAGRGGIVVDVYVSHNRMCTCSRATPPDEKETRTIGTICSAHRTGGNRSVVAAVLHLCCRPFVVLVSMDPFPVDPARRACTA